MANSWRGAKDRCVRRGLLALRRSCPGVRRIRCRGIQVNVCHELPSGGAISSGGHVGGGRVGAETDLEQQPGLIVQPTNGTTRNHKHSSPVCCPNAWTNMQKIAKLRGAACQITWESRKSKRKGWGNAACSSPSELPPEADMTIAGGVRQRAHHTRR